MPLTWAIAKVAITAFLKARAVTIALTAYGIVQSRKQARARRDGFNASLKDRTITGTSTEAPHRIIYGETLVGGVLVAPPWTWGLHRRFLSAVVAVASHEVESIGDIYFDDENIGPLDGQKTNGASGGGGNVQLGSPFYYTKRISETHTELSAPASGGTIRLEYDVIKFESIVWVTDDNTDVEIGDGLYSLDSDNRTLTILTGDAEGKKLVVTYIRSVLDVNDQRFDGVTAGQTITLPESAHSIAAIYYEGTNGQEGQGEDAFKHPLTPDQYSFDGTDQIQIISLPQTVDQRSQSQRGGPDDITTADFDLTNATTFSLFPYKWIRVRYYVGTVQGVPLVRIRKYLGIPAGERDTDLEFESAGQWTPQHLGKEIARFAAQIQYDADYFPRSMPNMAAVVRGKKCYDPRTGLTEFTKNPALHVRDYLTSRLGYNLPASAIDDQTVIDAANICDSLYTYNASGDQEPLYEGGGVVYCDVNLRDNLKALLSAMAGVAFTEGGIWRVYAGAYRAPTVTLTDDDVVGDLDMKPDSSLRDLYNSVRGQYVNPNKAWKTDDFTPYSSAVYIAEDDGREFTQEFDFPFTQRNRRAQRLARLQLHRDRQPVSFGGVFSRRAREIGPDTRFEFSFEKFGWVNKVFRCTERVYDPVSNRVTILAQEDAPEIWNPSFTEFTDYDPTPNTTLPNPRFVADLQGLTVTSSAGTYITRPDGTNAPFVWIRWDAIESSLVLDGGMIEILWKRAGEPEKRREHIKPWEIEFRVMPVSKGEIINFEIYAVNGIGVRSRGLFITHVVSENVQTGTGVPDSPNLLMNADWAHSRDRWVFDVPSDVPTSQLGGYSGNLASGYQRNKIPGNPSNVWLRRQAAGGDCKFIGPEVSVSGADYVHAFVKLLSLNATALMRIEYRDRSGSIVFVSESDSVSAAVQPNSTTGNRATDKTKYSLVSISRKKPDRAVTAQMQIVARDVIDTGVSSRGWVFATEPFLSGSPNGTIEYKWSPGPFVALPDPNKSTFQESDITVNPVAVLFNDTINITANSRVYVEVDVNYINALEDDEVTVEVQSNIPGSPDLERDFTTTNVGRYAAKFDITGNNPLGVEPGGYELSVRITKDLALARSPVLARGARVAVVVERV